MPTPILITPLPNVLGAQTFTLRAKFGTTLFAVTAYTSPQNKVHIWKSVDNGTTWSECDAINAPSCGNLNAYWRDGDNKIYLAYYPGGGIGIHNLIIQPFTLSNGNGVYGAAVNLNTAPQIDFATSFKIGVLSNGNVVAVYFDPNIGQVSCQVLSGLAVWSGEQSLFGLNDGYAIAVDSSNRTHVLDPGGNYGQIVGGNWVLGPIAAYGGGDIREFGNGLYFTPTDTVIFPIMRGAGTNYTAGVLKGTPSNNPVFTLTDVSGLINNNAFENPPLGITTDGARLLLAWAENVNFPITQFVSQIWISIEPGGVGAWDVPSKFYDLVTDPPTNPAGNRLDTIVPDLIVGNIIPSIVFLQNGNEGETGIYGWDYLQAPAPPNPPNPPGQPIGGSPPSGSSAVFGIDTSLCCADPFALQSLKALDPQAAEKQNKGKFPIARYCEPLTKYRVDFSSVPIVINKPIVPQHSAVAFDPTMFMEMVGLGRVGHTTAANHPNHQHQQYRKDIVQTNPNNNHQSTADTIQQMKKLVYESLNSPIVHEVALDIYYKAGGGTSKGLDELETIRCCFWWIKHHIRFKVDEGIYEDIGLGPISSITPTGMDLLISPAYLLQLISTDEAEGDCDDFSMLNATLLKALGIQNVFFCTIAADPTVPDNFTHVYTKVKLQGNGQVISLDVSHGKYPGWETNEKYKEVLWTV